MKKKILFMIETVTLSHIARSLTLASSLNKNDFDVTIAYGEAPSFLHQQLSQFKSIQLSTCASSKEFLTALKKGGLPYDKDKIRQQVSEDLDLISSVRPDIIVGDFRLSLSISARLSGVRYVNISNSTWNPQAEIEDQVPDLPIVRWLGENLSLFVFKFLKPYVFNRLASPYNKVAKEFGLTSQWSLYELYTDGDYTLFADVPGLVRSPVGSNRKIAIGPVDFEPEMPLPDWFTSLPTDKPLVYVNMGSSGDPQVLSEIVKGLVSLPVTVVVASAGSHVPMPQSDNLYVAQYLPSNYILDKASLFINNGGSRSSYSALARGVPLLCIPSNMDQFQFSFVAKANNLCERIRVEDVSEATVKSVAKSILENAHIQFSVSHIQNQIARTNSSGFFSSFICDLTSDQNASISSREPLDVAA